MDEALFGVLVLGALGAATAYVARERGRNPVAWFFAGFLGGIIGLALVFILPPAQAQAPRTASAVVPPASVLQTPPRPGPAAAEAAAAVPAAADSALGHAAGAQAADVVTCPRCGLQVPADAAFCAYCAHPLGAQAPAPAAEPPSTPASRACPDCAETIPVGARHCPYCGYAMTTAGGGTG